MGLLEKLPSAEVTTGALSGIIGDGGSGTGVAGVLAMLEKLDLQGLSGSLTAKLDGSVSASISVDTTALNGNISGPFGAALDALPTDGAAFAAPVHEIIERIKTLAVNDLSGDLDGLSGAVKGLGDLFPADGGDLLAGVQDRLEAMKGELIGGAFADIAKWSESVGGLMAELRPIVDGGPDGLEERLIAFLAGKAADVVKIAMPGLGPLAGGAAGLFDGALAAPKIGELQALIAELTAAFGKVRNEFDLGNFTNTLHLDQAEALCARLADMLAGIVDGIAGALGHIGGTAVTLTEGLTRQIDAIDDVEVIDIDDIRSKITEAIASVQQRVEDVDLSVVKTRMDDLFGRIDGALKEINLGAVTARIDDVQARLTDALDSVDGALLQVASVLRTAFASIRDVLHDLLSALGGGQPDGSFRFLIQDEIEGIFDSVKQTIDETVQPAIDAFRTTVGGVLGEARGALDAVAGEIDGVRQTLGDALQGAVDALDGADVPGTLEQIRAKLDEMLSGLGEVDFSVVTDPVVAEINEMRDALASIDISSLNEVMLGGLKVSVEVVISLDFAGDITAALMAEFDKLLEIPRNGLRDVEARVEGVLGQLATLSPDMLLAPLHDLFEPVSELFARLKIETLTAPIDAWCDKVKAEVEAISPAALLQPVAALHADLVAGFDKVSVETLIKPLGNALTVLRGEIEDLNFDGLTVGLEQGFQTMCKALTGFAPEKLIDPLVGLFDMLLEALDKFDPAALLQPINDLMVMIASPLARIEPRHIELMRAAFAPLIGLPAAFDPRIAYGLVGGTAKAVAGLLDQVNIGRMLSTLKGGFDPMQASFKAKAGDSEVSLGLRVDGLNPLRHEPLSKAIAGLLKAQADLKAAFPSAEAPADLVARYEKAQEKLDSLVPIWLKRLSTPEALRAAVEAANPLNVKAEVDALWEAVKDKLREVDPRLLQEHIRTTYEALLAPLDAFDPAQLRERITQLMDVLKGKLDMLDLDMIARETAEIVGEVRAVIDALDPAPMIAKLDEINIIPDMLDAIDPSALLGELQEPVEAALASIRAFDPATLLEPLGDIFTRIQELVGQIDVGILLQPLDARLTQLRDDLEENLKRTETAFKGMIAAIPLQAAA